MRRVKKLEKDILKKSILKKIANKSCNKGFSEVFNFLEVYLCLDLGGDLRLIYKEWINEKDALWEIILLNYENEV